jgi:transcriptional regulator NrdR family protein
MVCIVCGGKTQVVNSRHQKRSNQVWRRRQCLNCGLVFTSEEKIDYNGAWRVSSRQGQLRPFERDKLFLSLYKSCGHRQTALTDAAGLTDTVIKKLGPEARGGVISRDAIVRTVQVALNRFDKAASTHYQAFHA